MATVSKHFWERAGERAKGLPREHVEAALAQLLANARAAWPTLDVSDETFVERIAAQLPDGATIESLTSLHAADLYLACACTASQPAALAAFENTFFPALAAQLLRRSGRPDFVNEACQVIRLRLFFSGTDHPPKIASYTGKGPLGGWLRVVASRAAQNLRRDDPAGLEHSLKEQVANHAIDPELGFLKRKLGIEIKVVLEAAVATLSAEERTVLRHYFLDGLTVRELGKLYDVNASTITRWIASTRARILSEMRILIAQKMSIAASEVDSLMNMAQSQLEISLRQLLD